MSEDHDDALMRSLFAEAERPPMADERFVSNVMDRVGAIRARSQEWLNTAVWAGVAAAALLFLTNGAAIVAELSRPVMEAQGAMPSLGGGTLTVLLVAAAGGAAWLFSERA